MNKKKKCNKKKKEEENLATLVGYRADTTL